MIISLDSGWFLFNTDLEYVQEYSYLFVLCISDHDVMVLQIPLVIFKREKELARKLEFDGLYITEQPEDDDIKGQWDRLVINTP